MLISGVVLADTAVAVKSKPGRYTTVTAVSAVSATVAEGGLQIEGQLQRRHFSPRRPLRGAVVVAVHNAAGETIREQTMQASTLFVPKGIRQTNFSGVLEGDFPDGATVTVTPVN